MPKIIQKPFFLLEKPFFANFSLKVEKREKAPFYEWIFFLMKKVDMLFKRSVI